MPPIAARPWTAAGNAATPQKQEQEQIPLAVLPLPATIPPPETVVATAAAAVVAWVAAAAAVVAATVPPTIPAVAPVPFCAMAICSNMA